MPLKQSEKAKAIAFRKEGKTYSEILKKVPVAKSTLSLWLRDVGLSKTQKQKITVKKHKAQLRGGARRKEMRLTEVALMKELGVRDIKYISERELFLIGVVLYWGEGTKKSGQRPGSMVDFANSDPDMVRIFVRWLRQCCNICDDYMQVRLHLHISHKDREEALKQLWSKMIGLPLDNFSKTVYKKHNPKTLRYKTGSDYLGLVSIRVKRSTTLNRRILGWIYAIIASQK